jgi:hypothetical protein
MMVRALALQMAMLLHAARASSCARWSDAHCAAGSLRWIEMIRSKSICPLAKVDETKVPLSRRRAPHPSASTPLRLWQVVVSASGLLHYEDLLDSDGDNGELARAPPGFEMVDVRLLRREAELLLADGAGEFYVMLCMAHATIAR